jgi:NAD(P)-dependent dehydrogenase (short-subunit alcohol dehydrogenase family)
MLLGPVAGADAEEWDRMIAINVQGLLYTTRAACYARADPHQCGSSQPRGIGNLIAVGCGNG